MYEHQQLTNSVIGAAIEVHKQLGPGLLESAYEQCLCYELHQRGIAHERQVALPVRYKEVELDCGYRMDIVVAQVVLLELKSVEQLLSIHEAQLMTYLKLSGIKVGLLINFNVQLLRKGIIRRIL